MTHAELPKEWIIHTDLSLENIIGQIEKKVSTRHFLNNFCEYMTFVSQTKSNNINDALDDENWIFVMHDELNQYIRNDIWMLVPITKDMNIIGTK